MLLMLIPFLINIQLKRDLPSWNYSVIEVVRSLLSIMKCQIHSSLNKINLFLKKKTFSKTTYNLIYSPHFQFLKGLFYFFFQSVLTLPYSQRPWSFNYLPTPDTFSQSLPLDLLLFPLPTNTSGPPSRKQTNLTVLWASIPFLLFLSLANFQNWMVCPLPLSSCYLLPSLRPCHVICNLTGLLKLHYQRSPSLTSKQHFTVVMAILNTSLASLDPSPALSSVPLWEMS